MDSHDTRSKLLALTSLIDSPTFICICEHWLRSPELLPELPDYQCFASSRVDEVHGGVAFYVHSSFVPHISVRKCSGSGDTLWLTLCTPTQPLHIAVTYLRPRASAPAQALAEWTELEAELESLWNEGAQVLLIGDFNARIGTLDDRFLRLPDDFDFINTVELPAPSRTDSFENPAGVDLINLCHDYSLFLCNGRFFDQPMAPTCVSHNKRGSSTVDYMVPSLSLYRDIKSFKIHPIPMVDGKRTSDHHPLSLSLTLSLPPAPSKTLPRPQAPRPPRPKFDRNRDKVQGFTIELSNRFHVLRPPPELDSDGAVIVPDHDEPLPALADSLATLTDIILASACATFGQTSSNPPRPGRLRMQPWFDNECRAMKRDVTLLRTDPIHGPDSPEYLAALSRYLSLCKRKKKAYLASKENEFICKLSSDPRKAWLQFNASANPPLPDPDKLFTSFKSLFSTDPPNLSFEFPGSDRIPEPSTLDSASDSDNSGVDDSPCPLTDDISPMEVSEALKKLKNNRSPDSSGLRSEYLKVARDLLVDPLTSLLNRFFKEGFPTSLSPAFLCPIFKKGDPSDPDNYRGIAIISIMAKLYATVLSSRLQTALTTHNLWAKGQAGFRPGHSCSDQIFSLQRLREDAALRKEPLYCCFVDFSKAFDSVPRSLLWARLRAMNIPERFINALESYYSSVPLCVKTSDGFSDYFPSKLGVKQGCPLSPVLFSTFIDYIEIHFRRTLPPGVWEQVVTNTTSSPVSKLLHCLLYADDIALASSDPKSLQLGLDRLSSLCHLTGMAVNISKTKVLTFTRGPRTRPDPDPPRFTYNGAVLETVSEFRYLGFTFHEQRDPSYGAKILLQGAKRALLAMRVRCAKLRIRHLPTLFKLFHTLVSPVLLYASEVWFPYVCTSNAMELEMERFFLQFLRTCIGLRPSVPRVLVYLETGQLPLFFKAFSNVIRFYIRLSHLDPQRPLFTHFLRSRLDLAPAISGPPRSNPNNHSWFHRLYDSLNLTFPASPLTRLPTPRTPDSLKRASLDLSRFLSGQKNSRTVLTAPVYASTDQERKLHFYKPFLPELDPGLEPLDPRTSGPLIASYLLNSFSQSTRTLASFRCSGHSLRIEAGLIHEGIRDRKDRTCQVCGDPTAVEDESHFSLLCPSLAHIRALPEFSTLPFDLGIHELLSPAYFPTNADFLRKMLSARDGILNSQQE